MSRNVSTEREETDLEGFFRTFSQLKRDREWCEGHNLPPSLTYRIGLWLRALWTRHRQTPPSPGTSPFAGIPFTACPDDVLMKFDERGERDTQKHEPGARVLFDVGLAFLLANPFLRPEYQGIGWPPSKCSMSPANDDGRLVWSVMTRVRPCSVGGEIFPAFYHLCQIASYGWEEWLKAVEDLTANDPMAGLP